MSKIVFFFLIIAFVSCNSDKTDPSDKIIPKQTFEDILYKIHLSDAIVDMHNSAHVDNIFLSEEFYKEKILDSLGVDFERFRWNVVYYSHTKELDDIYAHILDRYNREKNQIEKDKPSNRTGKKKK